MRKILLEVFSIAFWAYALCKIFIFDIDAFIVENVFREQINILNYRIIFFLTTFSLGIFILGTKKFSFSFLFVLFYPIIVFSWKIPVFFFRRKSWIIAISFVNFIISFFNSFKYNVITSTIYVISTIAAFKSESTTAIYLSILSIFILTAVQFCRKFIYSFKPSLVFHLYIKIIDITREKMTLNVDSTASLKVPIEQINQENLEKWRDGLFYSVLQNRLYLFGARKLRDYQSSGLEIVTDIFSMIFLFITTTISFSIINYGIYKIHPEQFTTTVVPDVFMFYYYSFNAFLFNSISEVVASQPLSQAASMSEKFFALLLIAIFLSILISVKSQRSSKELDEIITTLKNRAQTSEIVISRDYNIRNIDEAIEMLEKLKSGTTILLLLLSKDANEE